MLKISGIRRLAAFGGHWKILFAFMVTVICASASCPDTPDAQITLSDASGYSATRTSVGTLYSLDCYHYYVVDITVPGGSPTGGPYVISGGFATSTQLTQANCADASMSMWVYKRSAATPLLPPSPWNLYFHPPDSAGTWVSGTGPGTGCQFPTFVTLVNSPGWNVIGYDEYLVQVLPKIFGVAAQAQVGIAEIVIK